MLTLSENAVRKIKTLVAEKGDEAGCASRSLAADAPGCRIGWKSIRPRSATRSSSVTAPNLLLTKRALY